MLFGKRDKKTPSERVEDLKARVDALRQADQTSRTRPPTLDQFLEGDDVLTGREVEDRYQPTGFSADEAPSSPRVDEYEAALAAELEKYIRREEQRALKKEPPPEATPRFDAPADTSSLLLDGTWSRDGDRRNFSDADRAWGFNDMNQPDPRTSPPGDDAVTPFEAPADWRAADNWPESDEPPARQEAV